MWFGEPHPFPERGSHHLRDWARRDNKVTKVDRVEPAGIAKSRPRSEVWHNATRAHEEPDMPGSLGRLRTVIIQTSRFLRSGVSVWTQSKGSGPMVLCDTVLHVTWWLFGKPSECFNEFCNEVARFVAELKRRNKLSDVTYTSLHFTLSCPTSKLSGRFTNDMFKLRTTSTHVR